VFSPIGAEWTYEYITYGHGEFLYSIRKIESSKDTVIDGRSVRKLTISDVDRESGDVFHRGDRYLYQSGDSIFKYDDGAFRLFYDFSLQPGDTYTYEPYYSKIRVDSLTTVVVDGDSLRGQYLSFLVDNELYFSTLVVEKLGPIQSFEPGGLQSSYLFYDEEIYLLDGPTIRFRCYRDSTIGEFKVVEGPCEALPTGTEYKEFAPDGARWVFSYERYDIMGNRSAGYEVVHYDRDTVIEGRLCKVLERTRITEEGSVSDNGNIIIWQDSAKIFTYGEVIGEDFVLLYDFDLDLGIEMEVKNSYNSFHIKLDSIYHSEINDKLLRNYVFDRSCGFPEDGIEEIIINEKFGATNRFLIFTEGECLPDFPTSYSFECYQDPEFGRYAPGGDLAACDITTSRNPVSRFQRLSVSPNPAVDEIRVQAGRGIAAFNYWIYTSTGNLIHTDQSNGDYLNVAELSPGFYFLILEMDGKRYVARFIKGE